MSEWKSLTWEEFEEQYKPLLNPFSKDDSNYFLETYGEELQYVGEQDPHYVWTFTDVEMGTAIYNGYHYVNRISYVITDVPWTEGVEYEVDLQRNTCDNCEEEFTQDFEHEDGLCEKCCKGCEMDEFNDE